DGASVNLRTKAEPVEAEAVGYRLGDLAADAVVITTPAPVSAELLEAWPAAAAGLAAVPYAGVCMVTLAFDSAAVEARLDGSGPRSPKPAQRHVTACSWASTKWEHLRRPDQVVLRASLGRFGDEHALELDDAALLDATLSDLGPQLGIRADPTAVRV